ncbi:relaxase/mobilization nuclease domain-containing protein [Mucilaginibacter boryungensis]|uniref:relaxase/mobilization nuclease domain-containing protein n=1 Tax=Mucilaginibacter boryungensis TaxID=768480 RepID=UPI0036385FE3
MNYNEQKVAEGVAVCLEAVNYPKTADQLSFNQKLKRFEKQAALNENTKVNCVHISLNFDPSERLPEDKLKRIAADYMDLIAFGDQPYLVYRHDDAGHPHIHIITTNIRYDGSRIELHNLGKNQSEKARKEIELKYGLLRPEDSKQRQAYELNPVNVQKVLYGKAATKRAVTTVLSKIIPAYKYTSLHELNAILKQYNIVADRGSVQSNIYRNNGLVYRILDEQDNKVGVPIKASDIYNAPTLKNLEAKFGANDAYRQSHKARVKNAIDWTLLKTERPTLSGLMEALKKQGIQVVIRQNEARQIYGITYVDHQTKCVFNGSDLGKQYSAKAIQDRCGTSENGNTEKPFQKEKAGENQDAVNGTLRFPNTVDLNVVDELLRQEYTGDTMPFDLKRHKKKKRKRLSNDQ